MMSLWTQELTRLNLLADLIAENRLSGELQIDWNPDISDIWPNAQRSWGIDPGDALSVALQARGIGSTALTSESAQRISWNSKGQCWVLQSPIWKSAAGEGEPGSTWSCRPGEQQPPL